jgi:hypothetical protein
MKPSTSGKLRSFAIVAGLCAAALISACTKNGLDPTPATVTPSGSAFVSVIDASPTSATYSVFADAGNIYPTGTLAYGMATGISGGSPYETIAPGTHSIKLISGGNSITIDSNGSFSSGGHYSFFVYDTGSVKTLVLNDNLTAPAAGSAEVRFLNLSPNSQSLSALLTGTDTTAKDSTSFTGIAYAGSAAANADSLSAFTTIPAGTYKVVFNSNTELSVFQQDSVVFASGKIYTIYSKGYNGVNNADSLGLGVIQNN